MADQHRMSRLLKMSGQVFDRFVLGQPAISVLIEFSRRQPIRFIQDSVSPTLFADPVDQFERMDPVPSKMIGSEAFRQLRLGAIVWMVENASLYERVPLLDIRKMGFAKRQLMPKHPLSFAFKRIAGIGTDVVAAGKRPVRMEQIEFDSHLPVRQPTRLVSKEKINFAERPFPRPNLERFRNHLDFANMLQPVQH